MEHCCVTLILKLTRADISNESVSEHIGMLYCHIIPTIVVRRRYLFMSAGKFEISFHCFFEVGVC